MVSAALLEHLMPFVTLEYGSQGEITLDERLFVEHYQSHLEVGGCVRLLRCNLVEVGVTPYRYIAYRRHGRSGCGFQGFPSIHGRLVLFYIYRHGCV